MDLETFTRADGTVLVVVPTGPYSFELLTLDGEPFNIGERLTALADERAENAKAS